EGDVAERLHPAECERHVVDRQQDLTGHEVLSAWSPHAARPIWESTAGMRKSRILTRALTVPRRPSSNVTSVAMSACVEPSYSASRGGAQRARMEPRRTLGGRVNPPSSAPSSLCSTGKRRISAAPIPPPCRSERFPPSIWRSIRAKTCSWAASSWYEP